MKGKPYRLRDKLGSKDIINLLNISSASFYRYIKRGLFTGLIKRDPISDNYYIEPRDLPKIKKILDI